MTDRVTLITGASAGIEFRATAEAWLVLAEKIARAEAIEALKAKGK